MNTYIRKINKAPARTITNKLINRFLDLLLTLIKSWFNFIVCQKYSCFCPEKVLLIKLLLPIYLLNLNLL